MICCYHLLAAAMAGVLLTVAVSAQDVLPGEVPAGDLLDGAYPYPLSPPATPATLDLTGFAGDRLGTVPEAGIHPRILFGPDDLPDLRRRVTTTAAGQEMMAVLRQRVDNSIGKAGAWENDLYEKLVVGDAAGAGAILGQGLKPSGRPGHYQPYIIYEMTLHAFDALISEDAEAGTRVGAAIATYAAMAEPVLKAQLELPLAADVWRAKVNGPTTGSWTENQGIRNLMGYHLMGYAYDFAWPYMNETQRAQMRRTIALATNGRIWLGCNLPHHWRNWNWIMVGLSQPLLALAIEGEEGYDPRVYRMGVTIARDYLDYGISARGCSTEAVGYTQFGFVWGVPFMVAATRRGDNLIAHSHHRAMLDWYLHSLEPFGGKWTSHGDGGDGAPAVWTLAMWRWFYPDDSRIEVLWQNLAAGGSPYQGYYHLIEPLIWATDAPEEPKQAASLDLPLTWFDPERSSLIARTSWSTDAAMVQFECRTDSVGASHEHADRGNFTFSALGRNWAKENFRSVETRYHNSVLIDGLGQGFWPGPGRWLQLADTQGLVIAAGDTADAYRWWWPKSILADPPDSPRFQYPRWATYGEQAAEFRRKYAAIPVDRDTRPSVVRHFQGFEAGDPRMWDEDGWAVRLPHNPVRHAFRTIAFRRGDCPYLLVVDDLRKDDDEHLYEWLMQAEQDAVMVDCRDRDVTLSYLAAGMFDGRGRFRPRQGEACLLVRVLDRAVPAASRDYPGIGSIRLETIERKDLLAPAGRSFGLDKRLVIPGRGVDAHFKILLYPFRHGQPLPETTWDPAAGRLTITTPAGADAYWLSTGGNGRTTISQIPVTENAP